MFEAYRNRPSSSLASSRPIFSISWLPKKIQAAGFRSLDLLAPNRIVDPAPDRAFKFGSPRKLVSLGHGFDLQDKRECPPASDAKVAGPKAANKLPEKPKAARRLGHFHRKNHVWPRRRR
jgi:hypothetical protein